MEGSKGNVAVQSAPLDVSIILFIHVDWFSMLMDQCWNVEQPGVGIEEAALLKRLKFVMFQVRPDICVSSLGIDSPQNTVAWLGRMVHISTISSDSAFSVNWYAQEHQL